MKVTIIGAGAVGATTAYALLNCGLFSEIVLIDVNEKKAQGEALDMVQATPFLFNCNIHSGNYVDSIGSDIVVITSGVGRKPGQSRLDLAQINTDIMCGVAKEIIKYAPKAYYIIVANPVDILTYVFLHVTGLPRHQVIGTGTILDTIRLRTCLADVYAVNPKQIYANVLGEHGDSSFVAWSAVTIEGIPIEEYKAMQLRLNPRARFHNVEEVESYVHTSGGKIIACKGCTVYGIATAVMHITQCLQGGLKSLLPVSTLLQGEYGIDNVCLSTLALVGENGVGAVLPQHLSDEEVAKLVHSADILKETIKSIQF